MIERMAQRARRVTPLNDTEKRIIKAAAKLFLENGFEKTTFNMISKESGVLRGNIAYYFHAKEDMLFLLVQEMFAFHDKLIEKAKGLFDDDLSAYAYEVMVQVSLCEHNQTAWDLYCSAYNHPATFEFVKEWGAEKTHDVMCDRLPDWTVRDFRIKENVASHIEYSALTAPCHEGYTLKDKIVLTLDSLLRIYDVEADERETIINRVLEEDYEHIGQTVFDEFLGQFYDSLA